MSTAAQITANQLNAARSTGPRTQEGKATSSTNATTHGLASHTILSYESAEDFNKLLASLANDFDPDTETEYYLVTRMAQARWRIARINRLMTATFDSLIGAGDPECPDVRLAQAMSQFSSDPVAKLHRYLNDAERSYYRAKRELENTQKLANKPPNETNPIQAEPTSDEALFAEIVSQLHSRNKANPPRESCEAQEAPATLPSPGRSSLPKSKPPVRG